MRLLIHGMQSSGSTAFTLFLAQRPDCLALVDVMNSYVAPRLETPLDSVVKVVVTAAHPLEEHVEQFRPDRTVLVLRDPRDNYQSLRTKNYRDLSGAMEEKFRILDRLFAERERFDAVIHYEDFVARDPAVLRAVNALGWPVDESFYEYRRRHTEIIAALFEHAPEIIRTRDFVFGNVRGPAVSEKHRDKPRDPELDDILEGLCPRLLAHYRARPRPTRSAAAGDPA
ncbi:hypothetical protein [Azospirillum sp. SYSU D00513]|uniref:hypothetical protein n=1 Tax=Azospirillum sp. SYSU D00513 TaxID=2812561 RepID=UPI001A95651E|nr:hypothetical protein [Azospirillum sp. SYSU D00513]